MADIKILIREGQAGTVAVFGTQVMVGDQKLERVTDISLGVEPGGVWKLTVELHVDPNTLFGTVPESKLDELVASARTGLAPA